MPYRTAGIDVHKKMLAVVVADVEVDGDFRFERQKTGTTPLDLRRLADWLVEHEVEEAVMESTAQHWRPVWRRSTRITLAGCAGRFPQLADRCRVSDDSGQRCARGILGRTANGFGRPGRPNFVDKFRTCNRSAWCWAIRDNTVASLSVLVVLSAREG